MADDVTRIPGPRTVVTRSQGTFELRIIDRTNSHGTISLWPTLATPEQILTSELCAALLPRVIRASRSSVPSARAARHLQRIGKQAEKWRGSSPGPVAPPVAPPGKLSPPIRQRKKNALFQKAFAGCGWEPPRSVEAPAFSLWPFFSEGWELRQFSTQLVILIFSRACGSAGRVPVRKRDWYAEHSANVPIVESSTCVAFPLSPCPQEFGERRRPRPSTSDIIIVAP